MYGLLNPGFAYKVSFIAIFVTLICNPKIMSKRCQRNFTFSIGKVDTCSQP